MTLTVHPDVTFAQSYPQLMNQALKLELTTSELTQLKQAFEFTQQMADGIYRAQGTPLLNHLIRTASIVLAQTTNINVVITALLHASYVIEKFDNSLRTQCITKRKQDITIAFGSEIAKLLFQYQSMHWYQQADIEHYITDINNLSESTRHLLLIRLANELEDHLDYAMLYTPNERINKRSNLYGESCVILAKLLGFKIIANPLEHILTQQKKMVLDENIVFKHSQGYELNNKMWLASFYEKQKNNTKKIINKYFRK